ncbi:terminal protein Tpg-like protein [Streptomyces sp. B1I3]|uniref:terminal protein Tpg-like protein n=1 Tax=Streptomyces sp. B1I3 TaxID=3042264 RepID=UPI002788E125|nr:terminal protein Tpg-like protein [Streptomyces sp. B1I3]MDQ0791679.1 hypothetical protein [Streptomyces sp. B1I3]
MIGRAFASLATRQFPPREVARELFAARDAGAGEQQMVILARTLGDASLRDGGRRGHGLHIALSDVEFGDFSIG